MEFAAGADAKVTFASNTTGRLMLDSAATFTGTVAGFGSGDTLDICGVIVMCGCFGSPLVIQIVQSFQLFHPSSIDSCKPSPMTPR